MKKQWIAALSACALIGGHAQAQSTTVTVPAVSLWVNSEIYVTNGEAITINANGNWSFEDGPAPLYGIYDSVFGQGNVPDSNSGYGDSDLFLYNNQQGSLIAFIGDDPTDYIGLSGYYWQVGSSAQFVATTNGYLWLSVNDDAVTHNVGDNDGAVSAQIFLGYGTTNSDWTSTRPAVNVLAATTNLFSFDIVDTNYPNTFWAVYDSADLKNWVLVGAVTLNDSGYGAFTNTTGVPTRFYKVSNGQTTSRVIGFAQITAVSGYTAIGNPFDVNADENASEDTVEPVFQWTSVPDGTQIWKDSGGVGTYAVVATWSSGSWSDNSVTLAPGEFEFIYATNGAPFTIIFAGLVKEGEFSHSFTGGITTSLSSYLPETGPISTILGYPAHDLDSFYKWRTDLQVWQIFWTYYDAADAYPDPAGWYDGNGNPAEPVISVGQGFAIYAQTNNIWTQSFHVHP